MRTRPTVVASERYRRPPEPWYWVAALLIPLAVTLAAWQLRTYLEPPSSALPTTATAVTTGPADPAATRMTAPGAGNPVDVRGDAKEIGVSAVVGDTAARDRLLDTVHAAVPDRGVVDETAVASGARLTDTGGLPAFLARARTDFDTFDLRLTDTEVVVRGTKAAQVEAVAAAARTAFPGRRVRTDVGPDLAEAAFACDRLEEQIGARLRRDPVNFESESAKVDAASTTRVREIGAALATCGTTGIRVNGHADSSGPQALNVDLAAARADAVREIIVAAGVKPAAVTSQGFGAWRNIAPNDTPTGRAENRRVVILVEPGARP